MAAEPRSGPPPTAYSGTIWGSRSTASRRKEPSNVMSPRQTALGRLLQERREAAGYSRTRVGELVGIKPGTIEGWELGRVARPPIHDVLRMAHFLRISPEEINTAVFEDAGGVAVGEAQPERQERKKGRRRSGGAVPLLEAAFRLFGWESDEAAAAALGTSPETLRG